MIGKLSREVAAKTVVTERAKGATWSVVRDRLAKKAGVKSDAIPMSTIRRLFYAGGGAFRDGTYAPGAIAKGAAPKGAKKRIPVQAPAKGAPAAKGAKAPKGAPKTAAKKAPAKAPKTAAKTAARRTAANALPGTTKGRRATAR